MSGWIKLEKELPGSIRFRRMLKKYGESQNVTVTDVTVTLLLGALVRYWFYVDTHVAENNTFEATLDDIDELVGMPGFARSMPREWLTEVGTQTIEAPGFLEHNGSSASERRRAAIRQNKSRANRRLSQAVTASNAIDQTRPDKTRKEKEKSNTASATRAADDADASQFDAFRALYPKRSGDQRWHEAQQAIRARLREGHTWEEIFDGARRYAVWCQSTGKVGTETVKQAATFVGPGKPFLEAWNPPLTKADVRLAGNLDAAAEFMRRTEAVR